MNRTIHQSHDQEVVHEVDGWTHEVSTNGMVLYRGWNKAKAEEITEAVSRAIHDAGQSQLAHCNAQLAERGANLGLSSTAAVH